MVDQLNLECQTVQDRVFQMRDDFKALAHAYAHVNRFEDACACLEMAIALVKFEEEHNITNAAWPPRPDEDNETGLRQAE